MSEKLYFWIAFGFPVLCYLFWIATLSYVIYYGKHQVTTGDSVDLSYLYQVQQDWETQPFVDVVVTSNTTCPASHQHEVFYDYWPGSSIFCDCLKHNGKIKMNVPCKTGKHADNKKCFNVRPMSPIIQAQLNGYRVCGARGGDPFVNATRGISLTQGGLCPSGYKSCGLLSSPTPDNTWCVNASLNASAVCPITSIQIINQTQVSSYPSPQWQIR